MRVSAKNLEGWRKNTSYFPTDSYRHRSSRRVTKIKKLSHSVNDSTL